MNMTTAVAVITVSMMMLIIRDEFTEIKEWMKKEKKWKKLRKEK